MQDCESLVSRRRLLGASATLAAWAWAPRFAFSAQGHDPRLVTIILRGALDGLSAVAPLGDPAPQPGAAGGQRSRRPAIQ